jgi:CBS domain-containing protein
MTPSQKQIESQVTELSTTAVEAFCADISVMFGLEAQCKRQLVAPKNVDQLAKRFEKLAAVCSVDAKGTLQGTFRLVFDRAGLFILAGITVPLSEEEIRKKAKAGSARAAKALSDAFTEAARPLVEAWDRLFREKLPGHDKLLQADTFIGNPWDKPQKKINLAPDEKFLSLRYEITVGQYPAFNCAVVLPKTIFSSPPENQAEPEVKTDSGADDKTGETAEPESEDKAKVQTEPEPGQTAEPQPQDKPPAAAEEETEPQAQEEPTAAPEEKTELSPGEQTQPEDQPASEPTITTDEDNALSDDQQKATNQQTEPSAEAQSPDAEVDSSADVPEEEILPDENHLHPVSDAIRSMTAPSAESLSEPEPHGPRDPVAHAPSPHLKISAKEIMHRDIAWASPNDSVQDALAMLQQNDAGYLLVGTDGKLEGLVSRSDVNGALSPYLQPMFAKWRRPLDDATLQIKIKWIMTRTIRTVNPDTSLAAIMETMCQFGWRALPVIDHQGTVAGLVTVFDIFRALLKADSNTSAVGGTLQAPLLA